jgi:N-acetylmuramoyl-L-alanine amidase
MHGVYISPSTQEHNIGARNYGTEEKQMNLIGDTVVQLLQYNHFEVYRNKPTMTLQEAVSDSNSKNVDIHFAIHSNAGGGKARGGEVFYTSDRGQKLAAAVYKYLEPLTPTADRGVKKHEKLYELNKTEAVAALAEVAFHDNADDAYFIMTHIQELGEAIAHGICDYFGVEFKKPEQPKPEVTVKIYRVQVGAFSVKANAEKMAADLKAKGYNPIIVEA